MKELLIKEIEQSMLRYLNNAQISLLHETLTRCIDNQLLDNKEIVFQYTNEEMLQSFLSAKDIEGCSQKTLKYYKCTLEKMINTLDINATQMTTEHLRNYLANYQKINNCSKTSIDNIRRNISSFFSWLEELTI